MNQFIIALILLLILILCSTKKESFVNFGITEEKNPVIIPSKTRYPDY